MEVYLWRFKSKNYPEGSGVSSLRGKLIENSILPSLLTVDLG